MAAADNKMWMEYAKPPAPVKPEPRSIPTEVKKALIQRKPGADSDQLLTDLIDVWGGPRQLALDLHAEFRAASPGGQNRQRILEMIQRLIVHNTMHDIGRSVTPSEMSDSELLSKAASLFERLGFQKQADGRPEPHPASES